MKTLALATLVLAAGSAVAAEESGIDPKAVHCIDLVRIQDTDIIDNQHMVFRLTGGKLYVNTLPHACPGLRRNEPYMVRTSGNRLCDLDIITMLHSTGFGFTPGVSCGLGMFEPATKEQIEALEAAARTKTQ